MTALDWDKEMLFDTELVVVLQTYAAVDALVARWVDRLTLLHILRQNGFRDKPAIEKKIVSHIDRLEKRMLKPSEDMNNLGVEEIPIKIAADLLMDAMNIESDIAGEWIELLRAVGGTPLPKISAATIEAFERAAAKGRGTSPKSGLGFCRKCGGRLHGDYCSDCGTKAV